MPPPRPCTPLLVTAVLLAACSTPSAPAEASDANPTPTVATPLGEPGSATATAASSPPATLAPPAAEPPPIALEVVSDGLAAPISISAAPDGWLLINEQAGRVVAVHPDRGERATALDITDRVLGGGERGLLGLALHPDWPADLRAFVHYSDRNGDTVLSELSGTQERDAAPALDPATERILLTVTQPFPNHNGGQLAFGPDGHLWMGLGDGGSAGDPLGHGQDESTLLGSILRLDVSTPGSYAIPGDNPFTGGGAPEVYLYGLRNPWRFSFDSATGLLWIADVGQNAYEEINRLDPAATAGANLGWNRMEAAHCFDAPGCETDRLTLPIVEYDHSLGCSVTGGHVYRGAIGGLAGWYLFGDYCSGLVFGIPSDAPAPADATALTPHVLLESGAAISSFGQGEDGEVYLVDLGGVLYRIVAAE